MNAVIVFTKYPRNGNVKTRLGKTLGNYFAAEFFKLMAEHIFEVCLSLPEKDYSLFLFFSEQEEKEPVNNWVDNRFSLQLQEGRDLGERMKSAFRFLFKNLYKKVIIIGTDCPEMNSEILLKSFNELSGKNVVIGPSTDGGYYLLGMDSFYPFLFDKIEWSSSKVFKESIKRVEKNKLSFELMPELIDVDTEEDMRKWFSKSNKENKMTKFIDGFDLRL
jgi:uncharacterized protein